MTNLPGAAAALQRVRREAPLLGVGLHLNLTEGAPLAPSAQVTPLLDGDGTLGRSLARLSAGATLSAAVRRAAAAELEAQAAWARDHGISATHVDGHKHVHLHPAIFPLVMEIARRHGIPAVRTTAELRLADVRRFLPLEWSPLHRLLQRGRALVQRRWGHLAQRTLAGSGLRTTDWFFGARATGGISPELIALLTARAPAGTGELMVHVGLPDDPCPRPTRLARSRPRELAAVTNTALREAFAASSCELITYREL